jgi:hypothetical protein
LKYSDTQIPKVQGPNCSNVQRFISPQVPTSTKSKARILQRPDFRRSIQRSQNVHNFSVPKCKSKVQKFTACTKQEVEPIHTCSCHPGPCNPPNAEASSHRFPSSPARRYARPPVCTPSSKPPTGPSLSPPLPSPVRWALFLFPPPTQFPLPMTAVGWRHGVDWGLGWGCCLEG